MKVLVTSAFISKNGNYIARGLVYSERHGRFVQVPDGHGGYQDTIVPISEEKFDDITKNLVSGYVLEVTRTTNVE